MPQKSKGDRDQLTARPPKEIGQAIRAAAKKAGLPVTDFVSVILAEYAGLTQLMPSPATHDTQQELDLPRTA